MAEKTKFVGIGKRKSSVARVSLFSPGKGNIEINGISVDKYVPRESLATIIRQPLNILGKIKDYDISVNVKGGGLSGQAGAIRLRRLLGRQQVYPARQYVPKWLDGLKKLQSRYLSIANSAPIFLVDSKL